MRRGQSFCWENATEGQGGWDPQKSCPNPCIQILEVVMWKVPNKMKCFLLQDHATPKCLHLVFASWFWTQHKGCAFSLCIPDPGTSFKSPLDALKEVDDGSMLGLGYNHLIKDSQWELQEAIFQSTYQEYLEAEGVMEEEIPRWVGAPTRALRVIHTGHWAVWMEASVLILLLSSQSFRAEGWSHSRSCHSAAYLSKPFFYIYFFLFSDMLSFISSFLARSWRDQKWKYSQVIQMDKKLLICEAQSLHDIELQWELSGSGLHPLCKFLFQGHKAGQNCQS